MTKAQVSFCKCADLPEHSLKSYMTAKAHFGPTREFGTYKSVEWQKAQVNLCSLFTRAFAARINDTHTANRACTWDPDTVMKAQTSLCKCADSPEPLLLEHRFPFEPTQDILALWRILRWACSPEHFLLAKMTPKSSFERARDFWHLSQWEVTMALASLHICTGTFVWAFATVLKFRVLDQMVIGLPLIRAANAWRVCTFAWDTQQCDCEGESAQVCAGLPESSSLDNVLSTKVSCWLKLWYGSHLC